MAAMLSTAYSGDQEETKMPLAKHVVDSVFEFRVNDSRVLRLPKFVKDSGDGLVYPQEILKAFIRYFNNLYQARATFAEKFIVDRKPHGEDPGQSHLDMLVFVPGELTREDFLDDLDDFALDHPGVKCELIKRWPKANEWNEAHKAEIEAGKAKPRKEGIMMAKNAASSWPKRKLETLLSYIDEAEPTNPYPDLSFEELEALEGKKDPKLKAYYEAVSEYDQHQSDLKGLLASFKEEFGHDFDKNSQEDREDLEYIYSDQYEEKIQGYREWYPASVRVHVPVGQFAPGQKGSIDLVALYDSKKEGKKMPANKIIVTKIKSKAKDSVEDNDFLKLAQFLGEAHDKIMEAQDLAKDLVNDEKLADNIEWDLEDLEAEVSEFEFMGEDDPAAALLAKYGVDQEDY